MPIAYKWWHSFHYQEWHPAKLHPLWFPLKSSKYPSKPWQSWKKRTYPPPKKSSPPPPENKALLKLLNHYFMKGARSRLVKGWAGSWPATAQARFYLGRGWAGSWPAISGWKSLPGLAWQLHTSWTTKWSCTAMQLLLHKQAWHLHR